jgi:hypothetical protein
MPENIIAHGMVNIHAITIFPASFHLTALALLVTPTPIIAPVIVCVVLTGIPANVTPKRVNAPAVSAQKPPMGLR